MKVRKSLFTLLLGPSLAAFACGCGDRNVALEAKARDLKFTVEKVVQLNPDVTTAANEGKLCAISYSYNPKPDFTFLLGPDSRVTFDESKSYLILEQGWVYLWGKYPRVRRGRVSTGAEGSAMAMWCGMEDGKKVIRAYFYDGTYAWWQLDSDPVNQWYKEGHYQEFIDDVPGTPQAPAAGTKAHDIHKVIEEWVNVHCPESWWPY